jgi:hypothetical protein
LLEQHIAFRIVVYLGMKTIFDYNPTNKELTSIFGNSNISHYQLLQRSDIDNIWLLCSLFTHRRDNLNYGKFMKLLPKQHRMDFERFRHHLLKG